MYGLISDCFSALAGIFSVAWNSLLAFIADARDTDIFTVYEPNPLSGWFTHGVTPVPCHSHDDYWRQVPLYSALAAGCISVEADVWLDGDELRVGHTLPTVLRGHTLRNLYLDPLLAMLQRHDPRYANDTIPAGQDPVGVFANDLSQTLVVLVDVKADGESTWPLLMEQLQPLREGGYLTYFDGSGLVQRPITVVVSGDAPFHYIEDTTFRDVFYDAPLDKLHFSPESSPDFEDSRYSTSNSYYASVNFRESIGSLPTSQLSQAQLAKVRNQIRVAHERGLKVRYWDTPKWPTGLRNYVWRVLVQEGVDILNVDDLHGATKKDWKSTSWWP